MLVFESNSWISAGEFISGIGTMGGFRRPTGHRRYQTLVMLKTRSFLNRETDKDKGDLEFLLWQDGADGTKLFR